LYREKLETVFSKLQVNPPHYVPLVEIVPAPWTESSVVERTRAIMKDIGQAPVTLNKEVNGFLLNRIQYAIIMEGWRLVEVWCLPILIKFWHCFTSESPRQTRMSV
jgi:3-hydroxyacyl-CoA dehydrogenase